jgi:hypothetical protein
MTTIAGTVWLVSRKPSAGVMPVIQLQPFDMPGMDFIGPFTPVAIDCSVYIIIAMDYFIRYPWTRTKKADGPTIVSFLKSEVEKSHGFPKSIYTDNATYFSQGQFQEHLNNHGIIHYPAPKTHPQLVGLSERYVRLLSEGLRKKLKQLSKNDCQITTWSYCLSEIIHEINTSVVKTHGFTLSELLLCHNPIR